MSSVHCQGADSPQGGVKWRQDECHMCMNGETACPEDVIKFKWLPNRRSTALTQSAKCFLQEADIIRHILNRSIDFVCDAGSTAVPLVEGNVVKAIAHLGPQRAPMLSNLATAREQGLPGIAVYGWNALFFPKETPEPIVRALNKAAGDMLERPALREQLHRIGLLIPSPERRSPNYLARFVVSEIETWAAPIKASGVSMD